MASRAADGGPRRARGLIRSTLVVAALRGLDFGLSFLVSVLLAGRFGATGQLDAFFLARRTTVGFADTIRKLVVQAVMPSVVARLDAGRALSIHGLPPRLYVFLGVFAAITLAGTAVPSLLVTIFAPGFTGARHDLTATMMAIMMPLLPLSVIASLLVAVLQANRRFWLSEGTNIVQRAMLVAVLAVAVPPLGIVAGAWTMLVAGIVGFLILVAGSWSIVRRRPDALLNPKAAPPPADDADSDLPRLGGGVAAAIVLNLYLQATSLIDFAVASLVAEGGVAALEYGARLVSLIPGLLMSSLYTVMLPELIRAMQARDRDPRALVRYQRMTIFGQVPISIGMMLGADLIVHILFGRGAFGEESIRLAAGTTAGYAAAAIFLAPMSAVTSAIYADPRGPCLADIIRIAVVGLAARAAAIAIGAWAGEAPGIAWGAAAATAIAAFWAQRVARRRFCDMDARGFAADVLRIGLCGATAAAAGWLVLAGGGGVAALIGGATGRLLLLAALGIAVVLAYAAAALALRVPEASRLRGIVGKALRRKLGRG